MASRLLIQNVPGTFASVTSDEIVPGVSKR
jgi:hypothetical protein